MQAIFFAIILVSVAPAFGETDPAQDIADQWSSIDATEADQSIEPQHNHLAQQQQQDLHEAISLLRSYSRGRVKRNGSVHPQSPSPQEQHGSEASPIAELESRIATLSVIVELLLEIHKPPPR